MTQYSQPIAAIVDGHRETLRRTIFLLCSVDVDLRQGVSQFVRNMSARKKAAQILSTANQVELVAVFVSSQ